MTFCSPTNLPEGALSASKGNKIQQPVSNNHHVARLCRVGYGLQESAVEFARLRLTRLLVLDRLEICQDQLLNLLPSGKSNRMQPRFSANHQTPGSGFCQHILQDRRVGT